MKRLRSGSKLGLIFGSGSKYNKMDPQHWQKCRTNIYKHFFKVFILVVYISWVESKPPSYFSSGSLTLRKKKYYFGSGGVAEIPVCWLQLRFHELILTPIHWKFPDKLNIRTTWMSTPLPAVLPLTGSEYFFHRLRLL